MLTRGYLLTPAPGQSLGRSRGFGPDALCGAGADGSDAGRTASRDHQGSIGGTDIDIMYRWLVMVNNG